MIRPLVTLVCLLGLALAPLPAEAGYPATGGGAISAGLGCGAQCITHALVKPSTAGATVEVRSDTPAVYRVLVSDQAPGAIGGKPWIPFPEAEAQTWIRARSHTFTLQGLTASTNYHILVAATDERGRTAHRLGTFRTLDPPPLPPAVDDENPTAQHAAPTLQITFWKIRILNDADKGSLNRGEISFDYFVNGDWRHETGERKLKSGASFRPHDPRWPIVVDAAPPELELEVLGVECDRLSCPQEAFSYPCTTSDDNEDRACASVRVQLAAFTPGALPPNYGTGMPAGHDGYLVFETPSENYLEFRVYAYVDVIVPK